MKVNNKETKDKHKEVRQETLSHPSCQSMKIIKKYTTTISSVTKTTKNERKSGENLFELRKKRYTQRCTKSKLATVFVKM